MRASAARCASITFNAATWLQKFCSLVLESLELKPAHLGWKRLAHAKYKEATKCSEVASACEKVLEWSQSLALIGHMVASYVTLQTIGCNAAIGACQRLVSCEENLHLLEPSFFGHQGLRSRRNRACLRKALEWRQVVNALYFMQGLQLQRAASSTWYCMCYSYSMCHSMCHSMCGACALPLSAGFSLSFTSITCNVSMKACESGRWRPAGGLACCNHSTQKRTKKMHKSSQDPGQLVRDGKSKLW